MDQGLLCDQRRSTGNSGAVPVRFSSATFQIHVCAYGDCESRSVPPLRNCKAFRFEDWPSELPLCHQLSRSMASRTLPAAQGQQLC